jgi:ABC-type transport system involved in multi-copper enzyme maturation permease subunit
MSVIKISHKTILTVMAIIALFVSIQLVINFMLKNLTYEETKETVKKSQYLIFIEVEDKTLYLLQDGKCIKNYPIASGMSEWPSPIGSWKIVNKGDWGEGFGGRWMGLNVPWGT